MFKVYSKILIQDASLACSMVEVQDNDVDPPSDPILFPVGLSFSCNLFSMDPVEAHGEDPPGRRSIVEILLRS